ncbi:MAG: metalloregulator ArsR/SmtB family transcription factor [Candidatus Scalindua sp.]|nr:metalloregulator ArsR/SmtB family transcription factor [Candidatus Scalindua sp.]MCR4343318.1 metalloregulator ArsR/SmtB family transcription factor [Candidatus Scalindua sp.]
MKFDPSEMFKLLGVETRIRIIELLKSKGSLGANKIAEILGITPAAVSQHLKVLRQAGLVRNERKGYWIPYSIDEEALENCRSVLNEVCTCGCKGTGKFSEKNLSESKLGTLKKYEKELQNELKIVRKRIREIDSS